MAVIIDGKLIEANAFSDAAARVEQLKGVFGMLIASEFDVTQTDTTTDNVGVAHLIWEGNPESPADPSRQPEKNIIVARQMLNSSEKELSEEAEALAKAFMPTIETADGQTISATPQKPGTLINFVIKHAKPNESGNLTLEQETLDNIVIPYLQSKRAENTAIDNDDIINMALKLGNIRNSARQINEAYTVISGIKGALQVLYPDYYDLAATSETLPLPDSGLSNKGRIKGAPAKLVATLRSATKITGRAGWVTAAEMGRLIKSNEENGVAIVEPPDHFVNALLYQYRRGGTVSEQMAQELDSLGLQIEFVKIPENKATRTEETVLYRVAPRAGTQKTSSTATGKPAQNVRKTRSATPEFSATVLKPRSRDIGATAITGAKLPTARKPRAKKA